MSPALSPALASAWSHNGSILPPRLTSSLCFFTPSLPSKPSKVHSIFTVTLQKYGVGRLSPSREPPTNGTEPCINVLRTDNFQRFQQSWAIFPKAVTSITYPLLVFPLFLSHYTCSFTPIPFNNPSINTLHPDPAVPGCIGVCVGGSVTQSKTELSCNFILLIGRYGSTTYVLACTQRQCIVFFAWF